MGSKSSTSSPLPHPNFVVGESPVSECSSESVPELVVVGVVRRAHGLRGELAVEVLSDVAGRISPGACFTAVHSGGAKQPVKVVGVRPHQDQLLVTFAEVNDRTAAEGLRGASLEMDRALVPPAPTGSFYQFDLVGCEVRDPSGGELGTVMDLLFGPGGSMLRVEGRHGELLIPFVEGFLERVDVERRRIQVVLPEGFVEVCGSKS